MKRGALKTRGHVAWAFFAALALSATFWMACALNPQPIPPGDQPDGGDMGNGGPPRDTDGATGGGLSDASDGAIFDATDGDAGDGAVFDAADGDATTD